MNKKTICLIILLITISPCAFAGTVTFITHGFALDGVETMEWVNDANSKLIDRIGDNTNVALYKLTLLETGQSISCTNGVVLGYSGKN